MGGNHVMVSMNGENTFDKILHSQYTELEGDLFKEDIDEKPIGNSIFSGETLSIFPIRMGVRLRHPCTASIQHCTGGLSHYTKARKKKTDWKRRSKANITCRRHDYLHIIATVEMKKQTQGD